MQHECKANVAFRFEFLFARKSSQCINNYLLTIPKYLSSRIAFRFYPLRRIPSPMSVNVIVEMFASGKKQCRHSQKSNKNNLSHSKNFYSAKRKIIIRVH